MRQLESKEINSVAGGLGYWLTDDYYDCYYDPYTRLEYCDITSVSTYYEYTPVQEALLWSAVGLTAAATIAGITAAIVLTV